MSKATPTFDAERHCDAMADTLGMTITQEQRPGVLLFLAVARNMFEMINNPAIADDTFDLAPVFRPGTISMGEAS